MPFIPHTPDEVQEMLSVVGVRNLDDLFADIPPEMRPKHFDLPKGQSEFAVCRYFEDLAAANVPPSVSFLGAGFYAHYVPSSIPPTRPIRPNARRAPCRPSSNTRPR